MRTVVLLMIAMLPAGRLADAQASDAAPITLAKEHVALLSIVTGKDAPERVTVAAHDLATYLEKISGASFEIKAGDGLSGIAVGVADDFPSLPFRNVLAVKETAGREAYILRSHGSGIYVIGATELAVENAVWDLLYHLGYRQFFPGKTWEVLPKTADLKISVDETRKPDYVSRRIWYGYGPWDYNEGPYKQWCLRNRAGAGFNLSTGHAYGSIVRHNKALFDAHPEFLALVDGKRKATGDAKLCIGNTDLRKLVVDYALRCFEKDPTADSISMDPSDGGGWCECEACAALGSNSDRALTLANEVAEAVNRKYQDKYVGIYAYNHHSPPPGIRVHPNVIISVACGFIKGGYTVDEIVSGWSKQGATLGIREYYSVNTWDRDMPGRARGGNLDYLKRTIPEFYGKGARFMSAESSDNWGPNGLGYYVASRLLWDIDEAKRTDEIVDDFLTRAFGAAKEPMAEFYRLIDGANRSLVMDDLMGRMFRRLAEARKLADTSEVVARINDLILYARYVELFDQYSSSKGSARQPAFETLIRHAYRMRKTMMVHTKALYRDLVNRDKQVTIPEQALWSIPEEDNPWKSSEPFTDEELAGYLSNGIADHPLVKLGFAPIAFSDSLGPASSLNLPEVKPGNIQAGRGIQTFYTWVEEAPSTIELKITGGLISWYRDRGNVKVELWSLGGASERGEKVTLVARDRSVPPDGVERTVQLRVKDAGAYKITVSDGGDRTRVTRQPGTAMTFRSSLDEPLNVSGRWSLYFYVPQGTTVIGMFGGGNGDLLDPDGQKVFTFNEKKAGYFGVSVQKGHDGKLWKISHAAGAIRLMTVLPYLARNAEELLLPVEVVKKDAMP